MATKTPKPAISEDGLRQRNKPAGSMFGGGMRTVSCLACGEHKDRAEGVFAKVLGKNTFFCSEAHRNQVLPKKKEHA